MFSDCSLSLPAMDTRASRNGGGSLERALEGKEENRTWQIKIAMKILLSPHVGYELWKISLGMIIRKVSCNSQI